ncbi:hypothetical protein [Geopseudomonas aromaticivorans]|uniref:hypothetical protein n=1 Tax=Geopseudomonas aromaticivorans TaxID=2849492 RepID=UPI0020C8D997|nr:hypothetical protein [Pseudomonas aromaticivorans]
MSKRTTEDHRALDVRKLHRAGALAAGRSCGWEWSRRGEVVASIGIEAESLECLRLRYQLTRQGKTEAKDYRVPITWTPCHLGGNRPWFLCPCCGRRVAKLYSSTLFACRHCLRLNYRSQQANKRDRPCDRSWDLRRALGCDEGFLSLPAEYITKPKGMHWRTFERKVEQLRRVDARALGAAQAMLGTIERKVNTARAALARC